MPIYVSTGKPWLSHPTRTSSTTRRPTRLARANRVPPAGYLLWRVGTRQAEKKKKSYDFSLFLPYFSLFNSRLSRFRRRVAGCFPPVFRIRVSRSHRRPASPIAPPRIWDPVKLPAAGLFLRFSAVRIFFVMVVFFSFTEFWGVVSCGGFVLVFLVVLVRKLDGVLVGWVLLDMGIC